MTALILFDIGFAAACGIGAAGVSWAWLVVFVLIGGIGFAAAFFWKKRFAILGVLWILCVGIVIGGGWNLLYRVFYLNAAISADGETRNLLIQATDYSSEANYGSTVDGVLKLDGKIYQIKVYLKEAVDLKPGDTIRGDFRLRVTTFGGREDGTYHAGKGIFLLAYQKADCVFESCERSPWWCLPAVMRKSIQNILDGVFEGDASDFARALLLGDSSELTYAVDTALKVSGIRHIIAVSGLHVSILYAFVSTLTMKRRYFTLLIGLPVLVLFSAVAGFTPSVVRACIMVGLMMIAQALGRDYDPPTSLAAAVTCMLLVNPLTITNIGFQLSVASVSGIFFFGKPITAWIMSQFGKRVGLMGKLVNMTATSIGISLSATILTAPLSAWYFGCVSLAAVFTNLLTLWMVSLIFYGIIAVCILSLFQGFAAVMVSKFLSIPIHVVLWIARSISGIPMAAVYTESVYIMAWLAFVYVLLCVYLLSSKKKPLVLFCCAVLGLCLAQTASFAEPLMDECRITVLDVGQGQSILLQSRGRSYLVDCGGDSDSVSADTAAEILLSQGITRLDGLILTHYDRDHAGGAAKLLDRIEVDLLIMPMMEDGENEMQLWEKTTAPVECVTRDMQLTCGDMVITIYGPIFPGESNENSLCVLFSTENCDILITGDRSGLGERSLLRRVDLPQVDVLIAGHHGSKNSTCRELLEVVQPEIVVISVGENHYGHPAPETLERIREYTDEIYRTDLNGTVVIRR